MKIQTCPLPGLLLLTPKLWSDQRGFFIETWQQQRYTDCGIALPFVQDNFSSSVRGTLRGLHFQARHPQGKLVMVTLGEIFDIAVDLRPGSAGFGRWFGTVLSDRNHCQMWIPPGFAHGFLVLSEQAHFHYKCTDFYDPTDEHTIFWNDPQIGIDWPLNETPTVSDKDACAPLFSQIRPLLTSDGTAEAPSKDGPTP